MSVRQAPSLVSSVQFGRQRGLGLERTNLCAWSEVCVDVCARVHAFFFFLSWGQLNSGHFSTGNSLLSLSKDYL